VKQYTTSQCRLQPIGAECRISLRISYPDQYNLAAVEIKKKC